MGYVFSIIVSSWTRWKSRARFVFRFAMGLIGIPYGAWGVMKPDLADSLVALGGAAIIAAVAWAYLPAGLGAAGVALVALGLLIDPQRRK
jgi:hypothetical protein